MSLISWTLEANEGQQNIQALVSEGAKCWDRSGTVCCAGSKEGTTGDKAGFPAEVTLGGKMNRNYWASGLKGGGVFQAEGASW